MKKNILQENMRRFRTRNLREQAEAPQVVGMKLIKQGYITGISSAPLNSKAQYRVDPALSVPAQFQSAGQTALMARLNDTQKQLLSQRKALIVSRKSENGKLVMQYIELI